MNLDGKAALVTGAGTGVGRATALRLAARGCSVLVNFSRSRDAAEEVAASVRAAGVSGVALQGDVAEDSACRALVEKAASAFGRLDVLVNNAGTTSFIPHADLERVGDDDWNRILAVNVKGPFQCARAAHDLLKRNGGGEVVNVSSVAGLIGTGSSIPYCASKAALNSLTLTLARVMGPEIRVNAVAPGFITGPWLREGLGEAAYNAIKSQIESRVPLGRVCDPADVAEAILALIEGSDLVTGQVLPVDGGMTIAG